MDSIHASKLRLRRKFTRASINIILIIIIICVIIIIIIILVIIIIIIIMIIIMIIIIITTSLRIPTCLSSDQSVLYQQNSEVDNSTSASDPPHQR
jgi:hypothetical protein